METSKSHSSVRERVVQDMPHLLVTLSVSHPLSVSVTQSLSQHQPPASHNISPFLLFFHPKCEAEATVQGWGQHGSCSCKKEAAFMRL